MVNENESRTYSALGEPNWSSRVRDSLAVNGRRRFSAIVLVSTSTVYFIRLLPASYPPFFGFTTSPFARAVVPEADRLSNSPNLNSMRLATCSALFSGRLASAFVI